MTVFAYASCAVTTTLADVPETTVAGVPVSAKLATAPGSTVIEGVVPVTPPWAAVTVWEPAVFRVTEKMWTPESPATKV